MSAALQMPLVFGEPTAWRRVPKNDAQGRVLADRHYSRQTVGAEHFMPPGNVLVLLTFDGRALWGVVENLDPMGVLRWRCTIFRNEGPVLSSALIRIATAWTFAFWYARYNGPPPRTSLTTEINAEATAARRSKRSRPGECFRRAGWRYLRTTNGAAKGRANLVVLEAPE